MTQFGEDLSSEIDLLRPNWVIRNREQKTENTAGGWDNPPLGHGHLLQRPGGESLQPSLSSQPEMQVTPLTQAWFPQFTSQAQAVPQSTASQALSVQLTLQGFPAPQEIVPPQASSEQVTEQSP